MIRLLGMVLLGLWWALPAQATVFYESSTEGRSCDAIVVDGNSYDGATWDLFAGDPAFPYPYTRCAISTPAGTKYWQWTTICAGYDGNGRCTPANDGAVQTTNQAGVEISTSFTPSTGTTLYLATFSRFSRIGSRDIWQDTGGSPNSWDKYLEFGGSTTRWGLGVGWPSGNYTGTDHKFTVDVWCSGAVFGSWCTTDHLVQNQNGYAASTPILLDYDRWYALVMAITLQTGGTGRIRVYVNGELILDRSQQTTNSSPSIDHIILHGTIAQGSGAQQYDAPDHHRFMDEILFTDDLTYLTNAGLMSDPEAGGGGGTLVLILSQGFVVITAALQWGMVLAFLWQQRQAALRALLAVHQLYWTLRYRHAVKRWQREAPLMLEHREYITMEQKEQAWQLRK